jgi:hypothetical protein
MVTTDLAVDIECQEHNCASRMTEADQTEKPSGHTTDATEETALVCALTYVLAPQPAVKKYATVIGDGDSGIG